MVLRTVIKIIDVVSEMKEPVKLFAAILYENRTMLENALLQLVRKWGETDFISDPQLFNVTDYYEKEMGRALNRVLVSFRTIGDASQLDTWKRESISIENEFKDDKGNRRVNVDTGYIDFDKIVLASTKRSAYKIYLKDGIWADMVLHYEKGTYTPFLWSFADFKDGRYIKDCLHIRELYKKGKKLLQ
jgi:hypothetical protein